MIGLIRGVARIFKGGGQFFIEKGKAGSERSERCLRRWVPGWSPGRHSISLDLKAPDCEKIDILNPFFLSEFFQYNDDFYGDLYDDFYGDFYGDTFVATNFLISLFLFFPLYDLHFILLASQRATQSASLAKGGGVGRTHRPPWLHACCDCLSFVYLFIFYCFTYSCFDLFCNTRFPVSRVTLRFGIAIFIKFIN